MLEQLEKLLKKPSPKQKSALLFSGGVDSLILAKIMKDEKADFECFTVGAEGSQDIKHAEKQAKEFGFKLNIKKISKKEVEKAIPEVISLAGEISPVKTGVGIVKMIAIEEAVKKGFKTIVVGSGADELFAGYAKMKEDTEEQSRQLVDNYWKDNEYLLKIAEKMNVELIFPYMSEEMIEFASKLPLEKKINKKMNKVILRELGKKIGLKEHADRKKTAAQYGSKIDRIIEKLAKPKSKTQYLQEKFPLGALFSSGKDSCYAMQKMIEKGFKINCLITIKSRNPYSYMFHTPAIEIAEMQSEAMQIPIIIQKTKGEKEKELKDLEIALKKAKEEYNIKGVITGALYSKYQTDRIQKICDRLKLVCFNPLWHMNQEQEMREIVENFEVILTGIAAYGLDKSWLGRKITEKDIKELISLNKKYGINPTGEGGEFESLVLDAPFFKQKIKIEEFEIQEHDENTARLTVKKATLSKKS